MSGANPLRALADSERVVLDVVRAPERELPDVGALLAGAAEVDITPPPGMPKAGHSRNARTGNGFRTRLRAHVLHLRAGTCSLTLVQCDLLAGSAIVQQLVADAVADLDVPLSGLFLGATHTHAGPGQFHGNALMNRFSSNRPGFDPAFTGWLVDRIVGAVREAVTTRRPARLAVGATEVWGLTRNRSVDAYLRNEGVPATPRGEQRKYEAVNPWLHLVRVDAVDGTPLAATAIFSIHGTGISHSDHAYNADVWAYLKGELARHIERASGTRPVVGAVEGTHGDVAPAVRPGLLVYPEAERVGSQIGAAAGELWDRLEAGLTADVPLGVAFREIDLAARPSAGGITLPRPAFGAATMAGAFENTTPLLHLLPPFRAGFPKPGRRGPHGAKWIVGGRRGHDLVIPPATFPSVLPLHLLRIGALLVVGLPFEVTVEAGRRVAAAVRATGTGAEHIAVSSLANEQFCYLTTPEEYGLQRYEGGNTLYGPQSQPFVAACAARLAADLVEAGHVVDPLPRRRFDLAARRYLPTATGRDVRIATLGDPHFHDPTGSEDGYWEWRWRGPAPGELRWHEPLAAVEMATPDGGWTRALDDQGYHLGVVHLGPVHPAPDGPAHRYATRWYTPYTGPARRHRLVVLAPERTPSAPFA
jgi:neutral ceramidase